MNLYHILQNTVDGYDSYSDAVVAAENEEAAKLTYPGTYGPYVWQPDFSRGDDEPKGFWVHAGQFTATDWARPDEVTAILIGVAAPGVGAGVICASFHAG